MPIDPTTTTPIFLAALTANAQIGPSVSQQATGLALGLFQYMQSSVTITSIDAGTLGVGTGIGPSIFLSESVLLPLMTASLAGHGIIGPMMPLQASAITLGICASLALGIVNTLNPLVGIGGGKVQFIPNGTGGAIFAAAFKESGMSGPMASNLGMAVGLGLDAAIPSAISVLVIAGTPNIVPGGGAGIGRVV